MLDQESVEKLVKQFRRCVQGCVSELKTKITLEIKRGDVALLSVPQTKNIMKTSRYNWLDFFPTVIFDYLSRLVNLFFLGIALIMLIEPNKLSPFYRWIVIFPLGINCLFYIFKEFTLDYMRKRSDDMINNQKTRRGYYGNGSIDENVSWKDLQIGDVVYLKKGDIVPADIILLDSGQVRDREALCMVDTQYTDGKSTLTKKRSSYLTQLIVTRTRQKHVYPEYRKLLTGKLEYEVSNGNTQRFVGYLKLKKDPKMEMLTIDNFIAKGSKIRQTSWIFGLVVYTGMDTKIMQCSRYSNFKQDYYSKITNFLTFLMLCLISFLALVSIIVLLSRTEELEFMAQFDPNATNGYKIFNLLVLYSQLLPITIFFFQDIIQFFSKFTIERNMIRQFSSQYTRINDPSTLSDMGQVDYMLLDKTGTLTTSYQKLDCVLFGDRSFVVSHDQIYQELDKKKKGALKQDHQSYKNNETDNEYLVNYEFDNIRSQNGPNSIILKDQLNQILPPLRTETKRNHDKFKQQQRKPVKPQHISYDVQLHQMNNVSHLVDVKVVSYEPDLNPISAGLINNSLDQPFRMQASLRKSIYQSSGRKQREQFNNPQKTFQESDDFISLVHKYSSQTPAYFYNSKQDEDALIYDSFMKCILLCHEARPVYQDETTYESFSKNEEAALTFASLCGYILERFNRFESPDEYFCKIGKEVVKYKVLGLNQFSYARNLNSIVVQAPQSNDLICSEDLEAVGISQLSCRGSNNNSLLICKGDYEALKGILDINLKEREELEIMLNTHKRRGVRMILYGTRQFSEKETEEYSKKFNLYKSSLTSQEDQLELLAKEYETKISIIGILGFKEELKPDAIDFIHTIKQCNISPWILSGDQEASTLSCAQSLELCDFVKGKLIRINETTKEEIFLAINSSLGLVQSELTKVVGVSKQISILKERVIRSSTTILQGENFETMNLFTLAINGFSLEVILDDPQLLSHFRFLSCICKTVIGYNLTPQHKQQLCAMIKTYFPNRPIVMAVGDGYNDALMMQEADISVEVLNKGRKGLTFTPQVNAGDILVSDLSQVKELLLGEAKFVSERTANIINYLFYQSTFLGMTLFYFNWFCSFTASSLHDSMMVFLIDYIFILPNIITLGLVEQPTDKIVTNMFPAVYVDGQIRRRYFYLFFLLQSFLEALVQSTCIFYTTVFITQTSTSELGQASDLQMSSLIILYTLISMYFKLNYYLVTCNFKLFFRFLYRKSYVGIITQFLSLVFLVVFIIVNHRGQFSYWNYQIVTYQIFTRFDAVLNLITNLILCLFISFVINCIVRIRLLPTAYEQFAAHNSDSVSWEYTSNEEILAQTIRRTMNISNIVRSVFTEVTSLSPFVQELLNPGDTQVTEMKLKTFNLEMKELIQEKKFRTEKLDSSLNHFRVIFFLLCLSLGIFILIDYLTDKHMSQFTGISFKYLALLIGLLFLLCFICTKWFKLGFYTQSYLITGLFIGMKIAQDWLSEELTISLSAQLVVILATITKTNMSLIPISFYTIVYVVQLCAKIITIAVNRTGVIPNSPYAIDRVSVYSVCTIVIISITIGVLQLYLYYKGMKQRRNDFLARQQIEQDNSQAQDILSILIPKFVQQSISSGVYSMQEAQDDVAILFLYICEFDSIMKEEGKNVVLMLDSLFRVYDNLCLQHGVQKIETVGYTYMAASGIKACEQGVSSHILRTEKTTRLVNLAYDMAKQVVGRKYGKGNQIEIKVGIHVGRVIAGVIGHHKPQFSLIGDPVNQTSRVCSTGDVGAITLSEQAFNKAKRDLKYYIKKQKQAKGLGTINTFQVFAEKPQNYQQSVVQQRFQAAFKMVRNDVKILRKGTTKKTLIKGSNILKSLQKKPELVLNQEENKDYTIKGPLSPGQNILGSFRQLQINSREPQQLQQVNDQPQENHPMITDEEEFFTEADKANKEKKEAITPDKLLLTVNAKQEDAYQNFLNITREKNFKDGRIILCGLFLTYLILTILIIIVRQMFTQGITIFIIRGVFLGLLVIIFPFFKQAFQSQTVKCIYWAVLLYGGLTTIVQAYLTEFQEMATISILELLYITLVSCNLHTFSFIGTLVYLLCIFVSFLALYIESTMISTYYVLYLFAGIVLTILTTHSTIRENIQIFNNLQNNEENKVKQLALVSQLLPTHAFLKLRNSSIYNKQDLTDEFYDVTLLFADIKGFTEYSNTQTPEGVVNMLRNLFTEFDKMCQRFNVYKVYTIGDCYVVMGFTNSAKRNEAINTVRMGLAMVEIIRDVRKKINFPKLDMRIGCHTGYVIGGIIGTDIVRYDIYGSDVSIANKMESNGEEGHVMISDSTKNIIERSQDNPFIFHKIKDVDLPKFGVVVEGFLVDENPTLKKPVQENEFGSLSRKHMAQSPPKFN